VAFGDPRVLEPSAAEDSAQTERSALNDLRDLPPLPEARAEVQEIAALFPGRSQVFLGSEATEERVKALHGHIGYLHLATHGILDRLSEPDSALVLSTPQKPAEGQDNGLLQTWEILTQMRLDADLVVLSACDSALGREITGEGLVGLTQAFLQAGARSVAASLWRVTDQASPALMSAFYRALQAGHSKDDALRRAQLELIRHPVRVRGADGGTREKDLSSPYYWAGFQLQGEWN